MQRCHFAPWGAGFNIRYSGCTQIRAKWASVRPLPIVITSVLSALPTDSHATSTTNKLGNVCRGEEYWRHMTHKEKYVWCKMCASGFCITFVSNTFCCDEYLAGCERLQAAKRAETLAGLHKSCPFLLPSFVDIGSAVLKVFLFHFSVLKYFLPPYFSYISFPSCFQDSFIIPSSYTPLSHCNATAALRPPAAIIHQSVTSFGIWITQLKAKTFSLLRLEPSDLLQDLHTKWNRDSSVGIVTVYWLDSQRLRFESRQGKGICLFTIASIPARSNPAFHQVSRSGVKQSEGDAGHVPPSSAEVKNAWSYTATPSYFLWRCA
jgi:hypothetical protein